MNLKLKLIKLSGKLKELTDLDEITLSDLAHAYLEISRRIYELLTKYHTKRRKLMKGFDDLLVLIQCIQQIPTDTSGKPDDVAQARSSVMANKDFVSNSMGFYVTVMQNLRGNTLNGIVIGISVFSFLFVLLSSFLK